MTGMEKLCRYRTMNMYYRKTPFITTSPIAVEKNNSSTEIASKKYSTSLKTATKTTSKNNKLLTLGFRGLQRHHLERNNLLSII